ncbi:hypothetical protein BD413DRAFT_316323 [Trametes elegans]|nr:hypothetical protein BD413DRAFT_316323 [Trametes elegans]
MQHSPSQSRRCHARSIGGMQALSRPYSFQSRHSYQAKFRTHRDQSVYTGQACATAEHIVQTRGGSVSDTGTQPTEQRAESRKAACGEARIAAGVCVGRVTATGSAGCADAVERAKRRKRTSDLDSVSHV